MIASARRSSFLAAALLALAMLGFAGVRSTVMQVAMASGPAGMPMCDGGGAMTGMGGRTADLPAKPVPPPGKSCPYCAAAAHAPVLDAVAPAPPSGAVEFVAYRRIALHGPRGPPAVRPRARDPPPSFLTV